MTTTRKAATILVSDADDTALPRPKRATLRMTESDFERFRWEILPAKKLTWQDLLTQATNAWLEEHDYRKLETKE